MQIKIDDIKLTNRTRKDIGDISLLADNINEIGLLHPIVINETNELVCGYRRVLAFKKLQRNEIPYTKVSISDLVRGEFSENAFRKDFTISEMVEIKRALEPEIKREGEIRMKAGRPTPKLGRGRTTEIIATALGIGHTSLEKAETLVDAADKQPEQFKELLHKVDNGKTSLDKAHKQVIASEKLQGFHQSPEADKDKKQVEEQITSQERVSTTAKDEMQESTHKLSIPKEQTTKDELLTPPNDEITIESLQDKLRIAEQKRDYYANKLTEKSPEFLELYVEIEQLKEIESGRIKHGDFKNAASLPAINQLQEKIDSLEERIKEQAKSLAKNRFEAELELKEEVIPLIILLNRVTGRAQVMIDAAIIKR